MSWPEVMHTAFPKAEEQVLIGLERRGLTKRAGGMFRDEPICLLQTIPDYNWKFVKFPVYLDGPPHLKESRRLKDEQINALLQKRGWAPLRLPHKGGRLSDKKLDEILDTIEEMLNLIEERVWR